MLATAQEIFWLDVNAEKERLESKTETHWHPDRYRTE